MRKSSKTIRNKNSKLLANAIQNRFSTHPRFAFLLLPSTFLPLSRSIGLPPQTKPRHNHFRCPIANACETDENSAPFRGGERYVQISQRRKITYDFRAGSLVMSPLEKKAKAKKLAAPQGVPRRSPTLVLTGPCAA